MRITLFILAVFLLVPTVLGARPYVLVLGVAQDAGIPQMGCESKFCNKARIDKRLRQMVSSIALVDPDSGERWIFDATPDLPEQFDLLKSITKNSSNMLDGIFLTHAHIGHYTGLMYLGRESMNAASVKVFVMPRMKTMLETNAPWSQLAAIKNIALIQLSDQNAVNLNKRISVIPFVVPHRDEFSETVGFRIKTDSKTLIFLPDIDKWEKFSTPLTDLVSSSDHLLIDGTFFTDGEISRPMNEVPHPFVSETMTALSALPKNQRAKVVFIHFNHSNPLVQGNVISVRKVKRAGFGIARSGMQIKL